MGGGGGIWRLMELPGEEFELYGSVSESGV